MGQAAGSPVAGTLAGATNQATAFYAFAAAVILTACVMPHPEDASTPSAAPDKKTS